MLIEPLIDTYILVVIHRRSKEQPPKWGHLVDISSYGVALEASPVGRAVLAEWCVVFHAFSRAGRSITKDHWNNEIHVNPVVF